MNNKQEAMMSGIAAALLLFTSIIDPLVSASLAIILLVVFSIYKYNQSNKKK